MDRRKIDLQVGTNRLGTDMYMGAKSIGSVGKYLQSANILNRPTVSTSLGRFPTTAVRYVATFRHQ